MSWEVVSCWIESHPGLASWVQAFGSIAAILAAIWIAGRDSRVRRQADDESKKSALWRAYTAVDDTVRRVGNAVQTAELKSLEQHAMDMLNSDLRQAQQHLKEAMTEPGLSPKVYSELFATRTSVEDVSYAVGFFYKTTDRLPEYLDTARSGVNQVMESRTTLKNMYDALK